MSQQLPLRHMLPTKPCLAIRTVRELLGHSDVGTAMIYTHVLKVAAGGTSSPLDSLTSLHIWMSAVAATKKIASTFGKRQLTSALRRQVLTTVGLLCRRNLSKPETSLFAKQIFCSLTHSQCHKPRLRHPRYSHFLQLDQHAQRALKFAI